MHHIKEFNRFAATYHRTKIIQTRVAKHLVNGCSYQGKRILDLGAGTGAIYKALQWCPHFFCAVDACEEMLALHPAVHKKIVCDFDGAECWQELEKYSFDHIFASSSLQWSQNLDLLFQRIAQLNAHVALALFTANTFKTIHDLAGTTSPIYPREKIIEKLNQFFSVKIEVREYKLFFSDTLELFRYIKQSGVSQGVRRLSYKAMKELMRSYPLPYLEFEVVFAWSND